MIIVRLFNSLSLEKEEFKPLHGKKVGFYACGPTLYDYPHIGNYRAFLFYDLLQKWLEHEGYAVKMVMNITDVDDKTIKKSREQGKTLDWLYDFYSQPFFESLKTLEIKPASEYPRATKHIPEMIGLIQALLDNRIAYKGEDGSVYFHISKFKDYGKLSHLNIEGLKAGASGRVGADEYDKESVSDFALWKAWTPDDGDVVWDAPFGKGRPGWHIECSAMSMHYLGKTLDIHAGGIDLKFPHHENEIAQSEGATHKHFAKYWVHNEHLLVNGTKMAKRLKNFYTLNDILDKGYSPKALRLLLLSTHYRSQLNFTFEALENAQNTSKKLGELAFRLKQVSTSKGKDPEAGKMLEKTREDLAQALNDDLDVANALVAVFAFAHDVNKLIDENKLSKKSAGKAMAFLEEFDSVFGAVDWSQAEEVSLGVEISKLVEERESARKKKDFKRADEIRDLLKKKGIILQDTPNGVVWKKA